MAAANGLPERTANTGRVHIVGAGIAGLAAAVTAAADGRPVTVYEAAAQAGGRCRSFHDHNLDRVIDNGNHLILGGNRAVFEYLALIGAPDALREMAVTAYPFIDLATDQAWSVRLGAGPIPWWILFRRRRPPDTTIGDFLDARKLRGAGAGATVADCIDPERPIFESFWQPLSRAVLNTDATEASARLLWEMLAQTLFKGGQASLPLVARDGLSAALVDPAIATLGRMGAEIRFSTRLGGLVTQDGGVSALKFSGGETETVAPGDDVILALPSREIGGLIPDLTVPTETRAIVNIHFLYGGAVRLPQNSHILGLIGGTAQWLFQRGDILSVTISDAGALAGEAGDKIGETVWREVCRAIGIFTDGLPPYRVIKEHRATIAQTPGQVALRPGPETPLGNVYLAGDWTDTGIPATIESAVRSGFRAARMVLDRTR